MQFIANIISFLKVHFGYLENSVDPDKPASFQKLADQDLHCFSSNLKISLCESDLYSLAKNSK